MKSFTRWGMLLLLIIIVSYGVLTSYREGFIHSPCGKNKSCMSCTANQNPQCMWCPIDQKCYDQPPHNQSIPHSKCNLMNAITDQSTCGVMSKDSESDMPKKAPFGPPGRPSHLPDGSTGESTMTGNPLNDLSFYAAGKYGKLTMPGLPGMRSRITKCIRQAFQGE